MHFTRYRLKDFTLEILAFHFITLTLASKILRLVRNAFESTQTIEGEYRLAYLKEVL